MKRTVLAIFLLFLLVFPPVVQAEETVSGDEVLTEEAVIENTEGLKLELIQHTQDPRTKTVEFDLVIHSTITSDRAIVTWNVTGTSELLTDETQRLYLKPGQTYVVTAKVLPRLQGTTKLNVKIEAFEIEGTYIASAYKNIGTLESGEVFPITDEYRTAQMLYYVQIGGLIALGVFASLIGGFIGYRIFRRWLHTPG